MIRQSLTAVGLFGALAIASGSAEAQTSGGAALSLGYNFGEIEDTDFHGPIFAFDVDYGSGPFTFDLDLARFSTSSDDLDVDGSVLTAAVAPKYWFSPAFGLGLYLSTTRSDSNVTEDLSTNSYGVEGTYRTGNFEGSLFSGASDAEDLVGDDVTISDLGLRLRYDVNGQLSLFGKSVNTEIDTDLGDADAQAYGLGASYDFNNGLAAFGSFQKATSDDLNSDITSTSVGVSYNLDAIGRPILISGEYAHLNADLNGLDASGHNIAVGATILLGDAKSKRLPGVGASRNLAKSDRNALDALVNGIGF